MNGVTSVLRESCPFPKQSNPAVTTPYTPLQLSKPKEESTLVTVW